MHNVLTVARKLPGLLVIVLAAVLGSCAPAPQSGLAPGEGELQLPQGPPPLPAEALWKLQDLPPLPVQSTVQTQPASPGPQAQRELTEAQRLREKGDLRGAIDRLERAARFEPDNPTVRRALALAYLEVGDAAKALPELRETAKRAGDDLQVQLLLGELLAAQQQNEQALVAFRLAVQCSGATPDNPLMGQATLRLGQLLEMQGYWTAAEECYSRLSDWVEQYGGAYAAVPALRGVTEQPEMLWIRRGELLLNLRRPQEAAPLLERAHAANLQDRSAARALTEALIAVKRFDRAESLLVEMAGEQAQAFQLAPLAEALCRAAGDPKMPRRIWEAFRKDRRGDPALGRSLARIADRLGAKEDAGEILQAVLAVTPNDARATADLAILQARQGKTVEALNLLAALWNSNSDIDESFDDAIAALADSANVDTVAEFLNQPASRDADHAARLYVSGRWAAARNDSAGAIRQYTAALEARKDFLPPGEALMDEYLTAKEFDRADQLVAQYSDKVIKPYLQAKVLMARGKFDQAAARLKVVLASENSFQPAVLLLADAYRRMGQSNRAVDLLVENIRAGSNDLRVYRRLFNIYLSAKRLNEARSVVAEAFLNRPYDAEGRIMQAELSLAEGRRPAAIAMIWGLLEEMPQDARVEVLAAQVELPARGMPSRQQYDAAMARLSLALRSEPRHVDALMLKAGLAAAVGRYGQAADAWQALYLAKGEEDFRRRCIAALMLDGQFARAVEMADQAAAVSDDMTVRQAIIDSLTAQKLYEQACQRLEAWLKDDGARDRQRASWYRSRLLMICEKSGLASDMERAQTILDEWLADADRTTRRELNRQKVVFYVRAKKYDQAAQFVEKLNQENKDPQNVPRITLLMALIDAKQFDQVRSLIEDYLRQTAATQPAAPALSEQLRAVGILWRVHADDIPAAVKAAEDWLAEAPANLAPRSALIGALSEAGKPDRALEIVQGWIKRLPASRPTSSPSTGPASAMDLARWLAQIRINLLSQLHRYDQVVQAATEYLNTYGREVSVLNLRSGAYSELKRSAEATADLAAVVEIGGQDPIAVNNLAYAYIDRGIKLAEARKLLQKALMDKPDEVSIQDTLGWLMYRQGEFGQAGEIFQPILIRDAAGAIEDGDLHPVIYDHAGDTFYRLGWKERAGELWRQSLKSAQAYKDRTAEIRQLLDRLPGKIEALRAGKIPAVTATVQEQGGSPMDGLVEQAIQ